jgi:hypothetical protein
MLDVFTTLENLRIGNPAHVGPLTIVPLLGVDIRPRRYITLNEALEADLLEITEISEHGSVPELTLFNRASKPVLLLDGEELVGAKQNRVLNVSVLAPSGRRIRIPVSCVEQGRWSWKSRRFGSSSQMHFAKGRAEKLRQVHRSMQRNGTRQSELAKFAQGCEPVPDQIGAIFARRKQVEGLELLDHPQTFLRAWPKLVRSYAMDAIEWGKLAGYSLSKADVQVFLSAVRKASRERSDAVGLGEEIRFSSNETFGSALTNEGCLVHLVAFPVIAQTS